MKYVTLAVIVRRHSGRRLFLSQSISSGEGLIYSHNSRKWSLHRRPFDGEILSSRLVDSRESALTYFASFKRGQAVSR